MSKARSSATAIAEWTAFAIAAAVVLAVVAGIVVLWSGGSGDADAAFSVRVVGTQPAGSAYATTVEIRNNGGRTAEEVQVVAELHLGEEVLEGEQVVQFIPGGGTADVVFVFPQDPGGGRLDVRVAAYQVP